MWASAQTAAAKTLIIHLVCACNGGNAITQARPGAAVAGRTSVALWFVTRLFYRNRPMPKRVNPPTAAPDTGRLEVMTGAQRENALLKAGALQSAILTSANFSIIAT